MIFNKEENMPKENSREWKEERKKLEEKLEGLDEEKTKLERFGDVLSLLTSLIVIVMYAWIVIFTFFHTGFIERMFRNGLNFITWTQMRFVVLLSLPLVIWITYDALKTFKNHRKRKSVVAKNQKLRIEISKELDRLENLIKNEHKEN
jgi:uncharacterized membrane protein